jgi:excisionase family DNA binding protein
MPEILTTREAGEVLGAPEWTIRRIVDELSPPVARFGWKRAIPRERLPEIKQALESRRRNQEPMTA